MSYLTALPLSLPFVPPTADSALEPSLRRALRHGKIALGDEEAAHALLEALVPHEGLEISVVTDSPRLLRDLDLLVELDRRHTVRIDVKIPAGKRSPSRAALFHAVEALAAEGIETRVLCSPWAPEIGEEALRELFEVAREAGASDVVFASESPGVLRRLFTVSEDARERQLDTLVRRLRLEHGFPRTLPGRG
jgi:DNA repair photolyase